LQSVCTFATRNWWLISLSKIYFFNLVKHTLKKYNFKDSKMVA
jgi:hypothetical protein